MKFFVQVMGKSLGFVKSFRGGVLAIFILHGSFLLDGSMVICLHFVEKIFFAKISILTISLFDFLFLIVMSLTKNIFSSLRSCVFPVFDDMLHFFSRIFTYFGSRSFP